MRSVVEWANDNAGSLNLLFAAVVAAATVVSVFLNRRLVNETVALRKAEMDPDIALYIEPRRLQHNLFDIVIRNVGRGPAYNVSFDIEPKVKVGEGDESHLSRLAILRDGLKYLAPEQELRTFVGTYHDLDTGRMTITVSYYAKAKGWRRSAVVEPFTIDVRQFEGFSTVGDPPERELIRVLRQIADDFHRLRNGWWSMNVRVDGLRLFPERWKPQGRQPGRRERLVAFGRQLRDKVHLQGARR